MSEDTAGFDVPIEHLLLVEDNAMDQHRLVRALRDLSPGLRVTVATSAEAAVAELADQRFDVAMVDWRLPDGTGERVLRRAVACVPVLPVVMMTGGDASDAERMIAHGAQDFVSKNAPAADIRRAVQYAVKRSQMRRQGEQRAQLRESKDRHQAMSRLAAGIAHDLNNTLAVVSMNLELLAELVGPLAPEADECLVSAREAAQAAAERCAQLRTYTGSVEVRSHPVDLTELVASVLRDQGLALPPLVDQVGDGPATVRGDVDLLRAVLERLLAGAAELGAVEPPRLSYGASAGSEAVHWVLPIDGHAPPDLRIRVAWRGATPDPTELRRRFDPFGEGAQGATLLLGECVGFLRAHSGALATRTTDTGGSFDIWLPRWRPGGGTVRPSRPAPPRALGALRVWVVDDEPMVLRVLVRLLRTRGMEVESFSDGHDAYLAAREGQTCDLLITDLLMPGMGGAELVELLRLDGWIQPIIVVTGYSDQVSTLSVTEGVHVLLKPFTNAALFEAIGSVLQAPG